MPERGLLIHFAYLWHSEHLRGREEGAKDRPCLIVSAREQGPGDTVVTVLPVTHNPHVHQTAGVEIPHATKRRLGMDDNRSWIVITEVNRFRWPGHDLRQISGRAEGTFAYGIVPPALFVQVVTAMQNAHSRAVLRITPR